MNKYFDSFKDIYSRSWPFIAALCVILAIVAPLNIVLGIIAGFWVTTASGVFNIFVLCVIAHMVWDRAE